MVDQVEPINEEPTRVIYRAFKRSPDASVVANFVKAINHMHRLLAIPLRTYQLTRLRNREAMFQLQVSDGAKWCMEMDISIEEGMRVEYECKLPTQEEFDKSSFIRQSKLLEHNPGRYLHNEKTTAIKDQTDFD